MQALFSHDDQKIFTVGVDKQIIIWDVRASDSESNSFTPMILSQLVTKCYQDLAASSNRLVAMGQSSVTVYNIGEEE